MKSKRFAFIAIAAAMLASCAGDDVVAEFTEPKEIFFSVSEAGSETRTGMTADNLTNFGISISNPISTRHTYSNIKVEKESGKWTPARTMLWNSLNETVEIVAVSPYQDTGSSLCGVSSYNVSVETDQSGGIANSDLLVYKTKAFVPSRDLNADGTLDIQFQHVMSRLDIVVTFDSSIPQSYLQTNPIQSLYVSGTKPKGTYSFTGTNPVTEAGDAENIRAYESQAFVPKTEGQNAKAFYSCILIPQTGLSMSFGIDMYVKETDNTTKRYRSIFPTHVYFEAGKACQISFSDFHPETFPTE